MNMEIKMEPFDETSRRMLLASMEVDHRRVARPTGALALATAHEWFVREMPYAGTD